MNAGLATSHKLPILYGRSFGSLSELRPEVVLVDVMLGDESGFELARQLAAHHRDGGPAVILISTYSAAAFAPYR